MLDVQLPKAQHYVAGHSVVAAALEAFSVDLAFTEAVEDLVAIGELVEGMPTYDIAQQVLQDGYATLTHPQRHLYDTLVAPALVRRANEIAAVDMTGDW